jgi:hypothetical protein
MVVLNVTDMTINANFTYHYSDGKANSTVLFVNIFSGYGNVNNLLFATGTGLKVGDPVYYYSAKNIVQVQSQTCGGVQRSTVVAFPQQGVQIYWDQNTGLMCDYIAPNESLFMFNTTLWNSSAPATDAFLVGFEVSTFLGAPLVVLIVFVYLRKRRRARR